MPLTLPSISLDDNGNLEVGAGTQIDTNFSEIKSKVNPLFIDVAALETFNTDVFETLDAFTLTFATSLSLPSGGSSGPYPTGSYLKSTAIQPFTIDLIEDSDLFVKMTYYERSFIESIIDTDLSHFKIKVGENTAINETVKLVSGDMITISQLYVDNEIQIKINSSVPSNYFKQSSYSITPTRPDPSNPYRYKVYSSAYVQGTLRVYVNTHRIPNSVVDQSLASIGEFYFVNTVPLSELPFGNDDIIYCDFETPVVVSPSTAAGDDPTLAKWWGNMYTASDSGVIQLASQLQPLRFYPLVGDFSASGGYSATAGLLRITSANPYTDITGSTDNGMETIFFILDTDKINHDQLKNWTFDAHHPVGYDNQNIWYQIVAGLDTVIPTSTESQLNFSSSDASVDINIVGSTIDFVATGSSLWTESLGIISTKTSGYDVALYSNKRLYFDGGTNTYLTYDSGNSRFEFFIGGVSVGRIGS